jgi:hypothetical protein
MSDNIETSNDKASSLQTWFKLNRMDSC